MSDWKPVARALLGSWPQQVTGWGKEGIAAYLEELAERGVTPDGALVAIRSWPAGSDFPPSAANLAAAARRDPSVPTADDFYRLVYGPRGVLFARAPYCDGEYEYSHDEAARRRADQIHPLLGAYVRRYGVQRLRMLEVDHDTLGGLKRRELAESWEQFLEATEGRDLAQLVAPRHGEMARLDPLTSVGVTPDSRPQLPEGEAT